MKELIISINNRKLINLQEVRNFFGQIADGKHLLTVKSIKKRSIQQNAYYWGVVVPLCRKGLFEVGYDEIIYDEEAHEVLKYLHLKRPVVSKQTGEVLDISGSTTKLTTAEFNEYIEKVCRWSIEYLDVYIPSPNEPLAMLAEYDESLNIVIVDEA